MVSSNTKRLSKLSSFFSQAQTKETKNFLLIGAGKFGSALAEDLLALGQNVTIIDKSQEKINLVSEKVNEALKINALYEQELEAIDFDKIDHCVISIGDNINDSLVITLNILRIFKTHEEAITVKAFDERQQAILSFMGITNFIQTEKSISRSEALKLVYSNVDELVDIAAGNVCFQVRVHNIELDGKTVDWLERKFKHNVRIIYVAKDEIIATKSSTKIKLMMALVVVSKIDYVKSFSDYVTEKIKDSNSNNS